MTSAFEIPVLESHSLNGMAWLLATMTKENGSPSNFLAFKEA